MSDVRELVDRLRAATRLPRHLALPETLTFEDWWDIGRELAGHDANGPRWAAGGWWAFGRHRYGNRARAAAQGLFALQALVDAAAVAQAFEPLRRRVGLSFDHHVAVAQLPTAEADALLDAAENDGWSGSEMRAAILRRDGIDDEENALPKDHTLTCRSSSLPARQHVENLNIPERVAQRLRQESVLSSSPPCGTVDARLPGVAPQLPAAY